MNRLNRSTPPAISEPIRRIEAGPWAIELLPACAYATRYVATHSAVGFAFDSQRGLHAIGSDRIRPFVASPNGLAFVPAGCDVYSESPNGGEYLRVARADGEPLNGPMSEPSTALQAFNNCVDQQAINLAHRMRRALLRASVDDDWEAWAYALVKRTTAGHELPIHVRGSMTNQRLRLLDEYIDAHLDAPLSVPVMARLLGLSEGYFMRAFRDATGKSPHSYLIDRRLARARTLLRSTGHRLVDIAHACGFASQAHLATVFKQRLGVSPGEWRE